MALVFGPQFSLEVFLLQTILFAKFIEQILKNFIKRR